MIKKLQTTTKYYAKTEEEAEGAVIMAESNTKGRIIKKSIQRKTSKESIYYEVVITEEFTTSKEQLEKEELI